MPEVGAAERRGYTTVWASGPALPELTRLDELAAATQNCLISTSIVAADLFSADDVLAANARLSAKYPGRVVFGLGGAHGSRPLGRLNDYFDQLDAGSPAVTSTDRLLSALGPKMLDLARDRTAGAIPVFATPAYTASAREQLGNDAALIIQQMVVVDDDPERARAQGRLWLGLLRDLEAGYGRHFARMGFSSSAITNLEEEMVDALIAWGTAESVAKRLREQRDAGADHVAIVALPVGGEAHATTQWWALADALGIDRAA